MEEKDELPVPEEKPKSDKPKDSFFGDDDDDLKEDKPKKEDIKEELKSDKPKEEPKVNVPAEVKKGAFDLKFHISKKVLYYVVIPSVFVLLLLFGLIRQGYVSDWINKFKGASATMTIVDIDNKPIEAVTAEVDGNTADSDVEGKINLTNLIAGDRTIRIHKTGFTTIEKEITLRRHENDLGTFTLEKEPAKKVDVRLSVIDYISEDPIKDAKVKLNDTTPIIQDNTYVFNQITTGDYKLEVKGTGYLTTSKDVTLGGDTTELEQVALVKSGKVVFESNRDRGLKRVYTANYDGSEQKYIVDPKGDTEDFQPQLSPARTKVLIKSTRNDVKIEGTSNQLEQLFIIDIDGKNLNQISDNVQQTVSPLWSPSGKYILYSAQIKENGNYVNSLYQYNVSAKTSRNYDGFSAINSYVMSDDDNYVLFTGNKQNEGWGIYVTKLDTYSPTKIADGQSYSLEFINGSFGYDISNKYYTYNPSSNVLVEASRPKYTYITKIPSPNGKYKAYGSERDGKRNLFMSDASDKNEVKLTDINTVATWGSLNWSSDSSFITFINSSQTENALYVVSTNGKAKAKKIVDVNNSYN